MTRPWRFRRCAPALALVLAVAVVACDDDGGPSRPIIPPPAACPTVEDFLHTVAIGRPPGSVLGAAVAGDIVFAAVGTDGVYVIDTSDPSDVRVVTTLPVADARAVDVAGTRLFVAAGNDGLVIAEVSDPSTARVTGWTSTPGCAVDVAVAGTHAYVANEDIGLVIIDVSTPFPIVRGIENTPGRVVRVAVSEPLVFLADEVNGLRIVNASDPGAPFTLKTVPVPGVARDVAVSGDIAAVAAREGKLQLVDVGLPGFASIVGKWTTSRDAVAVALAGSDAFVSVGSGGIEVVDVSDPASPGRVQTFGTATIVRAAAVFGDQLVLAEDLSGARVVSIATPSSPAVDAYLDGGDIQSVVPMGDLLVVADASFGLHVFDPGTRTVVGEIAMSGGARGLALLDSIAYVIDNDGVPVVDLHDPTLPQSLPEIVANGPFEAVGVLGDFIYLLESTGTLVEQRLDGTGVPRSLTFNGAFPRSLTVEGALIYLPERQGSVYVVDRLSMRLASIVPMGASAERVVFRQTEGPYFPILRGWVAQSGLLNGRAALEVYDFSNLIAPQLVGTTMVSGNAVDVAFAGTHLAVAEGSDGCEIFAFTAENVARPVGYYPEAALRVVASGNGFAVAAGRAGLLLIGLDGCLPVR